MTGQTSCHCQDIEAIHRLFAEYGRLLDRRDAVAWAALFTPKGEWIGGDYYGVIAGREALARFVTREFAGAPPCVHMFGNFSITVHEGGFRAVSWSRWMLLEQAQGGLQAAQAGSYADHLVKLPEGWRIERRDVTLDLPVMA